MVKCFSDAAPAIPWADPAFLFGIVFLLAFAIRITFVMQWETLPYGQAPLLDAASYDAWAKEIANGHLLRAKAFYQSPLYPYLLGAAYKIFGTDYLVSGLLNAFLGSVACGVLGLFALRAFGMAEGYLTGALAAFYQSFVFYTAPGMKESLTLCLFALFLLFAFNALRTNRLRDHVWTGSTLGLAMLTRGNALFLFPAFLAVIFYQHRQKALKNAIFMGAVFILCLIPSTVHNLIASGDFVPVNYADGFNLYIGHSPFANGTDDYPPNVSTNPDQEEIDTAAIASAGAKQTLSPSEVSRYWRGKAIDFAVEHPDVEVRLLKNKLLALWANEEAFDNYNVDFIRANFATALRYTIPWFALLSVLAAFGAVAARRDKRREVGFLLVFLFTYMLSLLPFYVTDRYRLPSAIFLLPLAGAAVPFLLARLHLKDMKVLGAGALVAGFFLALAVIPLPSRAVSPPAFNWGLVTIMYANAHRYNEATEALQKALALSPQDTGFAAIGRGAEAELALGHRDQAAKYYEMNIRLFPKESGAWFFYGTFKESEGDLRAALEAYMKARDLGPQYAVVYQALDRVYERMGALNRR